MFDFLKNIWNERQWIFSGAGVVFLTWFVPFLFRRMPRQMHFPRASIMRRTSAVGMSARFQDFLVKVGDNCSPDFLQVGRVIHLGFTSTEASHYFEELVRMGYAKRRRQEITTRNAAIMEYQDFYCLTEAGKHKYVQLKSR